jgi:hypothetical protein
MTNNECVQCETVTGTVPMIWIDRQYHPNGKAEDLFRCSCGFNSKRFVFGDATIFQEDFDEICIHLLPVIVMHTIDLCGGIDRIDDEFLIEMYYLFIDDWNITEINDRFNQSFYQIPGMMGEQGWGTGIIWVKGYEKTPTYIVKLEDKKLSCTCKGFKYYQKCKHLNIIDEREKIRQCRRELGISLATLALQ